MAPRFRKPYLPPATKSNPAKLFLLFASCRTISCPHPAHKFLVRHPSLRKEKPRRPLPLENFQRPPRRLFARPLFLHRPPRSPRPTTVLPTCTNGLLLSLLLI